jgi:hypothetical protein
MQLSRNLSLREVTKSNTAIKYGIDNSPSEVHLRSLKEIAVKVFQPIRDHFDKPIHVTSGYRSPELNSKIGGSRTSSHCSGEALDLDADLTKGLTNREIFDFIRKNLEFDQLIYEFGNEFEPDWVHVSYDRNGNRNQILVAYRTDQGTRYKPYGK